jgi:hypothetical protein
LVNSVESFQLELREIALTARRVKALHLPNVLAHVPIKVAVELIEAIALLEPLFQKSLDLLWQDNEQMVLNDTA